MKGAVNKRERVPQTHGTGKGRRTQEARGTDPRPKRTGPDPGRAPSQTGRIRFAQLKTNRVRRRQTLEPVWTVQLRDQGHGTYRWELFCETRTACDSGDGEGGCGSHCVWYPSRVRMQLLNDEIDGDGVTKALRRARAGDDLLCGVGGARKEGADVREDESDGGSLNDAGATCARTSGGSPTRQPAGACSD